ncbi:hypothetical protein Tco_1066984 [Tanacetum coccineum]|uniref:Reverse transcriptase domain-containing protein n=1 Tax=Tanacetum coccineum TaxID=301880 RepID=A0ABQ5HDI0_9ASTR
MCSRPVSITSQKLPFGVHVSNIRKESKRVPTSGWYLEVWQLILSKCYEDGMMRLASCLAWTRRTSYSVLLAVTIERWPAWQILKQKYQQHNDTLPVCLHLTCVENMPLGPKKKGRKTQGLGGGIIAPYALYSVLFSLALWADEWYSPSSALLGLREIKLKESTALWKAAPSSNMKKGVHNRQFHVSNLKKCYADEPLAVPLDGLHIDDKLQFVEEPIEITDHEVKRFKRSRIPLVKVRWNSRRGPEFTWEREDQLKKKYPQTAPSSSAAS